jgi:hypothetical protein
MHSRKRSICLFVGECPGYPIALLQLGLPNDSIPPTIV